MTSILKDSGIWGKYVHLFSAGIDCLILLPKCYTYLARVLKLYAEMLHVCYACCGNYYTLNKCCE